MHKAAVGYRLATKVDNGFQVEFFNKKCFTAALKNIQQQLIFFKDGIKLKIDLAAQ